MRELNTVLNPDKTNDILQIPIIAKYAKKTGPKIYASPYRDSTVPTFPVLLELGKMFFCINGPQIAYTSQDKD